ncbi:MAG: hypothetical protein PSX81_11955 [bacterium]|nr:hypothetical protein [bacterium]
MQQLSQKQISIFCSFVFLFLFAFAFIFSFERLNSDAGYYFFYTVNTSWFHIEHGRIVLVLAEVLTVIGSLLHLPLKLIALLYSFNHVLFAGLLAFICFRKFKDKNATLLIAILQFTGLKLSVFTPQFELYYGLGILVFTLSFIKFTNLTKTANSVIYHFAIGLLLVLIFTSHPMAIYCTFVGLLLFFFKKENRSIWILSFGILVFYFIWKQWTVSDYEKNKFNGFSDALKHNVSGFFDLKFIVKCLQFLATYYWDCLILFVSGIYLFIKKTTYKKAVIYILAIKGSLIIIWLMFPPENMTRYIEQVYFPFVFLSCIWLFEFKINRILSVGILCLFIFRISGMIQCGMDNKHRTEQMEYFIELAETQNGSKFYVNEVKMGKVMYEKANWSYGFETLLYSAIYNNKALTITKDDDMEYNNNYIKLGPDDFLFRPFEIIPTSALNQQYFKLENGLYKPLIVP